MNNRLERPEKDTCLVAELHQPPPWNLSLEVKRQESEMVIFDLVDRLLRDNNLQPHQVPFQVLICLEICWLCGALLVAGQESAALSAFRSKKSGLQE